MSGDGSYTWRGDSARLKWQVNGKTRSETMPPVNGQRVKVGAIKRRLRELLGQVDRNAAPNDPERLTLAEYAPRWLKQRRHEMSPRTIEQYESSIRVHLIPELGDIRLAHLQRADVLDWRAELADQGLAANTRRQLYTLLVMILNGAVEATIIVANPAAGIKNKWPRSKARPVLTSEQCRALLDFGRGDAIYPALLLALTTGMRRSEILALRWSNIDLQAGLITVAESVSLIKRERIVKAPKNNETRRVTIPANVVAELERLYRQQAEDLLKLRMGRDNNRTVCHRADGELFTPSALSLAFRRLIRRSGLPICRFHDLRHSHASALLALGVPVRTVAERLGHQDGGMLLLKTYAHSTDKLDREAADRLGEALGNFG